MCQYLSVYKTESIFLWNVQRHQMKTQGRKKRKKQFSAEGKETVLDRETMLTGAG